MRIEQLLSKLQKVKRIGNGEWEALCPAHNDHTPSLHIRESEGKILLNDKAGCRTEDIVASMGVTMADLFVDAPQVVTTNKPLEKIVATYDYKDEKGKLLFQVVRYHPKTFRQRRQTADGKWSWNLNGVRRVLYHLEELSVATADETICVVEGEKDADNLWNWGIVATTVPGGANAWHGEYAEVLKGHKVVIIPDKDTAGIDFAKAVAKSLQGKATVSVVMLPGDKVKDVTDWIEAGGNVEDLPNMEQDVSVLFERDNPKYEGDIEAIEWNKNVHGHPVSFKAEKISNERTGVHARVSITCDYSMLNWSYFNIERSEERTRLANASHKQLSPDVQEMYSDMELRRNLDAFTGGLWHYYTGTFLPEVMPGDEKEEPIKYLLEPYVIEGGGTILFAPPGRGKSYTAMIWAVCIHNGVTKFWNIEKSPVLFINLERSRQSVSRRLGRVNRVLGLPPNTPLPTLNARGKSLADVMASCKRFIKEQGIKVIFLDSISRAGIGDLTENLPVNRIIDALSSLCDSWVALGHTPRADDTHVFGGIHFDAGADLVIQLSSEVKEDGKLLGIGWQTVKQNDVPPREQEIYALSFNEFGVTGLRPAKIAEFPQVEDKRKTDHLSTILDYVANKEDGEVWAGEIEEQLGIGRPEASKILNHSGYFKKNRKEKNKQMFVLLDEKEGDK